MKMGGVLQINVKLSKNSDCPPARKLVTCVHKGSLWYFESLISSHWKTYVLAVLPNTISLHFKKTFGLESALIN